MIDFVLLAILGLVSWIVAGSGPWNAAINFVGVIIAGLIAMNYFEPLSQFLSDQIGLGGSWEMRWDIITFWLIFTLALTLLKLIGDRVMPVYAPLVPPVHQGASWAFGVLTAYVFTGITCTTLHMAPLPRTFLEFSPERENLFGLRPDRHWLGFTQYASEHFLGRKLPNGSQVVFDGAGFNRIPSDNNTYQVWSSFPIRYGLRRELYASGALASNSASPSSTTPSEPPLAAPARRSRGGDF